MTRDADASPCVLGTLRTVDGTGVVRLEDRYDTDIQDLWSALTDPERLARWYGEVAGELHEGGQFRVYLEGPDLNGIGRVEACEPPRRLLVSTRETDESAGRGNVPAFDQTMLATLTSDDDKTTLVIEIRGLPMDKIASYGVGWQLHAESLSSYLTGTAGPEVESRWGELAGAYQDMAALLE